MQRLLLTGASAFLGGILYNQNNKAKCCGIIGMLSNNRDNIAPSLSMGVQLLKNRGYDSAGIVTLSQQNGKVDVNILKKAQEANQHINCIQRLVNQVNKKIKRSHVGIGHTRWATCGQKVQKNAHPHYDASQKIYIVHNGIIGGYNQIKKKYLEGVKFNSQTDSQVAAQLIGKFKKQGSNTYQAIKKTQDIMKQTSSKPQWGIVVIDKDQPNKMWTTTNGSPILIGMNDNQFFVASQSIAFKKQADCFFVTGDGQIWQLETSKIQQMKTKLQKQGRLQFISHSDKAGVMVKPPEPHKSFYSYQIRQQSQIQFKPQFQRVQAVNFGDYLTFIACGSSYYAALTSHFFFKKLKTFKKVSFYDPAQLMQGDIINNQTVVLISQSGQTKDLINVIQQCKTIQGVKTIGIINVQGSTIARKVDFPIYIKVGREVSVAATKSMFHQCLNLIQLALEVAIKKNSAPRQLVDQMKSQLLLIPSRVGQTIQKVDLQCKIVAELLFKKSSIYLLAMRQTMPIAKQAALKIKQLNYIHAQALGACEMKHGPIALIQSDKPRQTAVILFILDNDTFEVCANAFDQMSSRNALVILVTDCKQKIINHYQVKKRAQNKVKLQKKKTCQQQKIQQLRQKIQECKCQKQKELLLKQLQSQQNRVVSQQQIKDPQRQFIFIQVPKYKHFSCMLTLIPMQILVQKISQLKGINPDMPRNLAKTVTV